MINSPVYLLLKLNLKEVFNMEGKAMAGKRSFTTVNMVMMALFAAVTCVLAPLAVPIGPVPISLTNLVIYISLYVLGWKQGTITYIVYLLLGLAGLPVFSGFEGGIGKFAGPTGGYLVGFILMSVICGIFIEKWNGTTPLHITLNMVGMILGTAAAYAFGTAWFCISTGTGVMAALTVCVFPFIIGDLIKMVVAAAVGPVTGRQIRKMGGK